MLVFWIEATPFNPGTAADETVRCTSLPLSAATLMNGVEWLPVIGELPTFSRAVFDGAWRGRTSVSFGEVRLAARSGDIDHWASLNWSSRPISIWKGEVDTTDPANPSFPAWGDLELMFEGEVESFTPGYEEARLAFTVKLPQGKVADATYAGTGGMEGEEAFKGNVKPYAAGIHKNQPAKHLSASTWLYQVHAYGPIGSLDVVRESGRPLDQTLVPHADAASLLAATVPATEIHYCLAAGAFRLGFEPVGDITADFNGDATGSFVSQPGAVIKRLLEAADWAGTINQASLDALDAAIPSAPVVIWDESGADIADHLDRIMLHCGGYWDVTDLGEFYVGLVRRQEPTLALAPEGAHLYGIVPDDTLPAYDVLDIEPIAVRPPFHKNRMGYDRNPRPLTAAELAAIDAAGEQTFYRRSFTLPATPTGTTTPPTGWSVDRPALSAPLEYGASFSDGPISQSGPIYAVKFVDGAFGTPYLDDQDYVGAALLPPNKFTPYNSTTPNPQADLIEVATHEVTRDATPTHFETVSGVGSVPFPDTFAWTWFQLANGFDIEFEITSLGSDANGIEAYAGIGTGTPSLTGSGLDVTPIDFGFWFKQAGASRWESSTSTAARVHIVADSAIQTASVVGLDKGGVNEPALLTRYRMTYDGFIVGFYINGEPVCHSASFFQDFAYRNLVIALASPESSIRVTRFQEIPLANRPGIDSVAYMSGPIVFDNDSFAIYMPYDDNDAGNASAFHETHFEATTGAVVWDFVVDHDEVDLWAGLYGDTSSGYGELSIRFYGDGTYQIYRNATGQGIVAMPSTSFLAVRLSYDGTFMRCYLDGTQVHSYGVTVPQHRTYRVLNLRRSFAILISSRFAVSPISSTVGVAPTALPTDTDIGTKTWTEADTVTRNGYNAYPLADFEVTVGTAEGGVQQVLSVIANITYTLNSTNKPSIATGTLIGYYLTSSTSSATTWLPIDMSPEALALPSNPDTTNPTSTGLISFPPGAYTFEIYGVVTDSMSGGGNYSITATGTHITRAFN